MGCGENALRSSAAVLTVGVPSTPLGAGSSTAFGYRLTSLRMTELIKFPGWGRTRGG